MRQLYRCGATLRALQDHAMLRHTRKAAKPATGGLCVRSAESGREYQLPPISGTTPKITAATSITIDAVIDHSNVKR